MKIRKYRGKLKMVIISVIIIFFCICLIFIVRAYQLNKSSVGEKISKNNIGKALIVLDIQKDTVSIPQYKNSDELIYNINNLIEKADSLNIPVIYSKQVVDNPVDIILTGGKYKKGTEGINLSEELLVTSTNNIFDKSKNDLFSNKDFEKYLFEKDIGDIYIIGADALACVSKTTEAALNRGYKVTLFKDSIFAIEPKYLDKVMTKYQKKGAVVKDIGNFD